ncbi:MAG: hypothetical protein ABI415_03870 [Flavitalea sp.]
MLKRYLPFLVLVVLVISCSKDKLSTKPSIAIKSINGTEFTLLQDVVITLTFKDKEGDLGNGSLTYLRNRLNVYYPVINDLADSVGYALPEFPKTTSGEIKVIIPSGFLSENPQFNDTVNFKIFVKDVAGNVSDTVTTPTLISVVE